MHKYDNFSAFGDHFAFDRNENNQIKIRRDSVANEIALNTFIKLSGFQVVNHLLVVRMIISYYLVYLVKINSFQSEIVIVHEILRWESWVYY